MATFDARGVLINLAQSTRQPRVTPFRRTRPEEHQAFPNATAAAGLGEPTAAGPVGEVMNTPRDASLPRYVVGIDVETTALEPAAGEIIDVAAIRYDLETGQEVERFTSLAKPQRSISSETTAITGITNEMVKDAPSFAALLTALQEFIGEHTLFAHNSTFDVRWLTYHGLKLANNPVWDTFMLATIAWPESDSYNLGTLAGELGLPLGEEHRAAADVVVTWHLLQRIREQLIFSAEDIAPAKSVLVKANLAHYVPLLRQRQAQNLASNTGSEQVTEQEKTGESLPPAGQLLGTGGILEQRLPGFSVRAGQIQMAEAIAQWVATGTVGFIEAGTGIGKTYAYLAGVLPAVRAGQRVLIATYTRHLQDQLLNHDMPRFFEALQLPVRFAALKGRRNYVCYRRLQQVLVRASLTPGEAFFLLKILRWLGQGGSGDLERLNTSYQAQNLVRQLHADALSCRTLCPHEDRCPYYQAKKRAEAAQVVVINHALLAQWALEDTDAWRQTVLVVDEAHHLEEAARAASAIDLSPERLAESLAPLVTVSAQQGKGSAPQHLAQECQTLLEEYTQWLGAIQQAVSAHTDKDRLLLTPTVRRGSHWQRVEQQAAAWRGRLKFILGLSASVHAATADQATVLREAQRGIERLAIELENFIEGNTERIQWVAVTRDWKNPEVLRVQLHDVALSVGPFLRGFLQGMASVILTSATLTVRGTFDYIQQRLGVQDAPALTVPNLFNYKSNMLLYLVDDSPYPNGPEYEEYVAGVIKDLALTFQGRLLGLFSSQKSLGLIYKMLVRPLNKGKIKIYAQKLTGGRHNILQRFQKVHRSVLLGTLSFWEGVDVPGESLSAVVIAKLPFPAPDDPVLTAVALAEERNLFADLFLPQMILRLRQGVGRLLRQPTDRGVVVLLDSRLHQHEYGREVLKSLPAATVHVGSHRDIKKVVVEWMGEKTLRRWRQHEV